jgi:undecaprenyl-diphosphatase
MNGSPRNPLLRFLLWVGSHELGLLLCLAGIAAGIWIFAGIAGEVTDGDTQRFDRVVLLSMRNPDKTPLGPRWLQEGARDITALGSVAVLSILTIGACGFLALDNRVRLAWFTAGSFAGGLLMSTLLKHIFNRPRPDLVPWSAYVYTTSFPSGHSMLSAVTYLTLGALLAQTQQRRTLKAWFMLSAVFITIIVGVSRVYLAVHWPTDVLAGWTAGSVWALVCWLGVRRLQKNRDHLLGSNEKDI